jgi:diguanylate cyclase (GGDEF)-like protein
LLQDQLQHAIKVAKRNGLPVVVMLIDIVRLSDINDILGYGGGDLVLQEIASRLQKSLRESDIVARLGGDEFVIVLQDVLFEDVGVAVAKIRVLFEQNISVDDTSLEIEAVFGVAMYPEHGETSDILLQRANIAMRVAKKEISDFSIYSSDDDPHSLRRLKLFGELRQAITNKELLLYYQPQIDISTGRIISVEALARWPHPDSGMIPPDDFIPMIEQSGLIRPFTLWVLEEAIMQLRHWSQQGINLSIAVNLSARNLLDPDLPNAIAAMLESHRLSSAQLTLEVTESAIMTRPENALKLLTKLHEMGFKLSIDDFGTGYSSLAYLKKFPVDELKIDQSFVFDLADRDDDAIIVRSTIELAHNMGMKVVAEGVESEDILSTLSILNCDLAQGYYMSRPIAAQDLEIWLAESPWGISAS